MVMTEPKWTSELAKYWGNVLMLPYIGTEMAMNWPDRYISSLTWYGWIEFKNLRTILRDAQWLNIVRLQQFGTMACVVRRTQIRKDFENEKVEIYITDRKQFDAETTVNNLLPTLARMFRKIRDTTHNYIARPGFFAGEG